MWVYNIIKNRKERDFLIGFYGGEPLLNFETLKRIIKYSKVLFSDWDIKFNMTTNGTILNDDIIDYLVSNKIRILVSLDGPREVHDKKRVYPNGNGSFDLILDNLKKIIKRDMNYYLNMVRFSITWSRDLSVLKIYDFFSKNKVVNKNSLVFAIVHEPLYYDKYPFDKNITEQELCYFKKIIDRKIKKERELNNFEHTISYRLKFTNSDSLMERTFDITRGTCLFNNMVYVDTEGKFHVCHLMSSKFIIGDVWGGFDFKKMTDLANNFISTVKKFCLNCTVRSFCKPCYVFFSKTDKFSIDKNRCDAIRKSTVKSLEDFIESNENKTSILKLTNNTISKQFHQFVHIAYSD